MWAVSVFVSVTLAVCLPGQLFFGNVTEFPMAFEDALPSLLAVAVATALVVAAVLFMLPKGSARDVVLAIVFAVGCLAWIQSQLPWPYGIADGRAIVWAAYRRHGAIDAAMWIAGVAAAGWWRRRLVRVVGLASLILAGVQAVALSVQAAGPSRRWIDDVTFVESSRFTFSADRNVVIVLLDTFQTDLFQELLDSEPTVADGLRGFTYFRNATGGFPSTAAAVPLILSGRYYDNSEPFQRFVRNTYRTASIQQALTDAGFDSYYHNLQFWPSLYADESIASHVRAKGWLRYDATAREGVVRLLTFSAFRYLPQPGKRLLERKILALVPPRPLRTAERTAPALEALYRNQAAIAEPPLPGDGPFFQQLAASASTSSLKPAFRYFHLWGLHPPLTHDEDLQPMKAPFTRENALRQARGLLKLVDRFVATFEQLGIYDRSMLAILGDHGTAFKVRLPRDGSPHIPPDAVATSSGYGLPLILVKRPGERGPMRISDAPVALGDVARTVLDTVGLPSDLPGVSMFAPDIPTTRSRRVLYYRPGDLRLMTDVFPPLREFRVSGFSWIASSWRPTGRVFTARSRPNAP